MNTVIYQNIIAAFLLLVIIGFILSIFVPSEEKKQEKLLKEIRDELHKKNKKDEAKEGKVIQ